MHRSSYHEGWHCQALYGILNVLVFRTRVQELIQTDLPVLIPVHFLKQALHSFGHQSIIEGTGCVAPHEFVHGAHNVVQIVPGNDTITVDVVQAEDPAQLFLHGSSAEDRETFDKIFKIQIT